MPLVKRNHEVQTLSSYGLDQSPKECIRLGRLWRSSQDPRSEPLHQDVAETIPRQVIENLVELVGLELLRRVDCE